MSQSSKESTQPSTSVHQTDSFTASDGNDKYITKLIEKYYKSGILNINERMANDLASILDGKNLKHLEIEPSSSKESVNAELSYVDMGFTTKNIRNWETIKQNLFKRKRPLPAIILRHFETSFKSDFVIQIGDEFFECHKIVLKSSTKYFQKYFKQNPNSDRHKLNDKRVTPVAFEKIYKKMVSEEFKFGSEDLLEIYSAAIYLGIEDLIQDCNRILCYEVHDEYLSLLIYLEAKKHKLKDLKKTFIFRINKIYLTFVASVDFLNLSPKEMYHFLQQNDIGVNNEIELFYSLVRWITYHWESRRLYLKKLLHEIRYKIMPVWFTIIYKDDDHPNMELVKSTKVFKDFIYNIFYYENLVRSKAESDESNQSEPQYPRHWIFDKNCQHHHFPWCQNIKDQMFTYSKFLEYLIVLSENPKMSWRGFRLVLNLSEKTNVCCDQTKDHIPDTQDLSCNLNYKNEEFLRKDKIEEKSFESTQ